MCKLAKCIDMQNSAITHKLQEILSVGLDEYFDITNRTKAIKLMWSKLLKICSNFYYKAILCDYFLKIIQVDTSLFPRQNFRPKVFQCKNFFQIFCFHIRFCSLKFWLYCTTFIVLLVEHITTEFCIYLFNSLLFHAEFKKKAIWNE